MELTDWLLNNSDRLSLRAEKYRWIDEWLPGFFDYGVIIKVDGKDYSGRGIDKNEQLAFEKAASEALERAAVKTARLKMLWSTAAYPNYEGAALRAYRELVGIDRVFCHHYSEKKIRRMDWGETGGYFPDGALYKQIKKSRIDFSLYELRPTLDSKVVCGIASGGGLGFNGFLSGFGADKDIKSAAAHAAIECLRTVAACLLTEYSPKEPLEVLKRRGEPRWHYWMAQSAEALAHLKGRLLPRPEEQVTLKAEDISISDVSFERIDSLRTVYPDLPLEIAQAKSEKMIAPQFGEIRMSPDVLARLRNFSGAEVSPREMPPHFYG